MEIGNYVKPIDGFERVLTIGKIKYMPIAVNPTKAELQALRDNRGLNVFVPQDEPVYIGKQAIDSTKPDDLKNYFDVTIYMQSYAFPDTIERINYRVYDAGRKSSTGKFEVINAYGNTTWMEKANIDSKKAPVGMEWFVMDGIKYLRRGEGSLVAFVRALRNLKNVQQDTADKEKLRSLFSDDDIKKMLKGDIKNLKNIILEIPDALVTFVTGIRTNDSKKYQDFFRDLPMKSYIADSNSSDDYILKVISEAQENGRYANTNFFLTSGLSGREYIEGMEGNPNGSSDDFEFPDAPQGSESGMSFQNTEAEDDLPF